MCQIMVDLKRDVSVCTNTSNTLGETKLFLQKDDKKMLNKIMELSFKCMGQVTKSYMYHQLVVLDYYVLYRERGRVCLVKCPLNNSIFGGTHPVCTCAWRLTDTMFLPSCGSVLASMEKVILVTPLYNR